MRPDTPLDTPFDYNLDDFDPVCIEMLEDQDVLEEYTRRYSEFIHENFSSTVAAIDRMEKQFEETGAHRKEYVIEDTDPVRFADDLHQLAMYGAVITYATGRGFRWQIKAREDKICCPKSIEEGGLYTTEELLDWHERLDGLFDIAAKYAQKLAQMLARMVVQGMGKKYTVQIVTSSAVTYDQSVLVGILAKFAGAYGHPVEVLPCSDMPAVDAQSLAFYSL